MRTLHHAAKQEPEQPAGLASPVGAKVWAWTGRALLVGDLVRLGMIREADVDLLVQWNEDGRAARLGASDPAYAWPEARIRKWWTDRLAGAATQDFAIRLLDEGSTLVGTICLGQVDATNRVAELGTRPGSRVGSVSTMRFTTSDASATEVSPMRSFDPVRLGHLEADAWIAYYQRRWLRVLTAAIGLVRRGFGMGPYSTLMGAWWVLRANQAWAPADNDPDAARRHMTRFYRLVVLHHAAKIDPAEAARLDVEWWWIHRRVQQGDTTGPLVQALADLYAYVYGVPSEDVTPAAAQRAAAMGISDEWVAAGCPEHDPRLDAERAALVRSYAALLHAVHR